MSSIEEVKGKLAAASHSLGQSRGNMSQVERDIEQQISALRAATEGSDDSDMQGAIAALQAELSAVQHTNAVVGKTITEIERYAGKI